MTTLKTDCPHCDPLSPELDEDGRPYDCYVCCNTGRVSKAYADAYWQARTDEAEYRGLHPVTNGKHEFRHFDEEGCCEVRRVPLLPASLFPKPARPVRARPQGAACAVPEFDDIPF